MPSEEVEMLRKATKEFGDKYILNNATKIEREGISEGLRRSLAEQGFLGIAVPQDLGGAGVSGQEYVSVLREFASFSPSVAALVLIDNSITTKLIGNADPILAGKIATGEADFGVSLHSPNAGRGEDGSLTVSGDKVSGTMRYVINATDEGFVALSDDDRLILVKGGITYSDEQYHLSFRGLKYSSAKVDSADCLVLSEKGPESFEKIMEDIDLPVAAMALGIADASLNKAVEYTKVRKTFGMPLKDYSPVANTLSRLLSELKMAGLSLEHSLELDRKGVLMLKTFSTDLAKRATKSALQMHGGYGYIEDFGVENFYRDAAGLSVLFQNSGKDILKLAQEVFGERSGFV